MRRALALATQSTGLRASALSKCFLRLAGHVLLKHLDEITVRIAKIDGCRRAAREMHQSAVDADSGCLEACIQPGDVLNMDRKMADALIRNVPTGLNGSWRRTFELQQFDFE